MKKSILVFSAFLFISFSAIAQDNFLAGNWKFEKIPDHVELDEQQKKMAPKMFGEMTVSFDGQNFSLFMMGGTVTGTWEKLDDGTYTLSSEGGMMQGAVITKVSDNQINLKPIQGEMQLIKIDSESADDMVEENSDSNEDGNGKSDALSEDFLIGGQWVFDKIPVEKDLSKQEQDMATDLFGTTTLSFISKEKYTTTMGKMSDEGAWRMLDDNSLELKSSSGMKQKLGIKKLSDSQIIITFNETIDIVMKKSGK